MIKEKVEKVKETKEKEKDMEEEKVAEDQKEKEEVSEEVLEKEKERKVERMCGRLKEKATRAEKEKNGQGVVCYNCGKTGHVAFECWSAPSGKGKGKGGKRKSAECSGNWRRRLEH